MGLIAAGCTLVDAVFADVTAWSLHPFYKWRLARTFAVRRVADAHGPAARPAGPYQELLH